MISGVLVYVAHRSFLFALFFGLPRCSWSTKVFLSAAEHTEVAKNPLAIDQDALKVPELVGASVHWVAQRVGELIESPGPAVLGAYTDVNLPPSWLRRSALLGSRVPGTGSPTSVAEALQRLRGNVDAEGSAVQDWAQANQLGNAGPLKAYRTDTAEAKKLWRILLLLKKAGPVSSKLQQLEKDARHLEADIVLRERLQDEEEHFSKLVRLGWVNNGSKKDPCENNVSVHAIPLIGQPNVTASNSSLPSAPASTDQPCSHQRLEHDLRRLKATSHARGKDHAHVDTANQRNENATVVRRATTVSRIPNVQTLGKPGSEQQRKSIHPTGNRSLLRQYLMGEVDLDANDLAGLASRLKKQMTPEQRQTLSKLLWASPHIDSNVSSRLQSQNVHISPNLRQYLKGVKADNASNLLQSRQFSRYSALDQDTSNSSLSWKPRAHEQVVVDPDFKTRAHMRAKEISEHFHKFFDIPMPSNSSADQLAAGHKMPSGYGQDKKTAAASKTNQSAFVYDDLSRSRLAFHRAGFPSRQSGIQQHRGASAVNVGKRDQDVLVPEPWVSVQTGNTSAGKHFKRLKMLASEPVRVSRKLKDFLASVHQPSVDTDSSTEAEADSMAVALGGSNRKPVHNGLFNLTRAEVAAEAFAVELSSDDSGAAQTDQHFFEMGGKPTDLQSSVTA